ncbi:Mobile element protein [Deinococcus marmoris]
MEARAIFDQQHMMIWTRAKTGRKRGNDELVSLFGDLWNEPELTGSRFGTDEGVEIEPLVTWLNRTDGWLTGGGPKRPRDGLQSDPMFVHCPK